jgi:tRNA1Val (adenine37-N6)-methyltransferase
MPKREDLLSGALKIVQPDGKEGPRVNVDTILLAHFTRPRRGERILELGCAHGAVSLILAKRGFEIEGADIQEHLIELARENAKFNGLEEMTRFYCADLREYRSIWGAQSYDRVVVNPPYDELPRSNRSPYDARAAANQGLECTLAEVVGAARYLLKNRGRLNVILRASRAAELLTLLEAANVAPKVMKSVHPKPGADAASVLVEAVRAAGSGIKVKTPLFIRGTGGEETPELLAAYRLGN